MKSDSEAKLLPGTCKCFFSLSLLKPIFVGTVPSRLPAANAEMSCCLEAEVLGEKRMATHHTSPYNFCIVPTVCDHSKP